MRQSLVPAIWAISLATVALTAQASLVNQEVKRVIDVGSTVSISRTTIRVKNTGSGAASSFFLAVHKSDAGGLGDLWVTDASAGTPLRALPLEPSDDVPGLLSCCSGFKVSLSKSIAPGAEATYDIRMDVVGRIKPIPDVIDGHDDQYMRFFGNLYFYTPYETKSMTTTVTLGSPHVSSKNGLEKPFDLSGKKLTLGPYEDIAALSHSEFDIRFRNNRGFLVARRAVKDFYLNHLGQVAVKEQFDVFNGGAKHTGEWSRVDHSSRYASKYGAAMGDVWANLPADATHIIYKDLIGNVTSSRLRKPHKGKRPIQLVYRYPLMGGWNNLFWVGYEIMLKNYLSSEGNNHIVELPLFPSLNTDMLCNEYEVRVFLPEWSHNYVAVPHASLQMSVTKSSERTTLTMFGRPMISIKFKILRSQSKHAKTLTVKYSYDPKLAYIAPVLVACGILLIVVGFILSIRSALSVVDQQEGFMDKPKEKSL